MRFRKLSILHYYLIFFFFCSLCSCFSSTEIKPVSPQAQHKTKVWILERYPQIVHPKISELFDRSSKRLYNGISTLNHNLENPRLYVIESDEVTAFSLCDGSIFLSTSLISNSHSVEVFVATLAHEFAHIINKDACFTDNNKNSELQKEIDADVLGAKILYASFINPKASLHTLTLYSRKIKKNESRNSIEKRKNNLLDFLSRVPEINSEIPEERLFRKVQRMILLKSMKNRKDLTRN